MVGPDSPTPSVIRSIERETLDAHRLLMAFGDYRQATPEQRAEMVVDHLDHCRVALERTPALRAWVEANSSNSR